MGQSDLQMPIHRVATELREWVPEKESLSPSYAILSGALQEQREKSE